MKAKKKFNTSATACYYGTNEILLSIIKLNRSQIADVLARASRACPANFVESHFKAEVEMTFTKVPRNLSTVRGSCLNKNKPEVSKSILLSVFSSIRDLNAFMSQILKLLCLGLFIKILSNYILSDGEKNNKYFVLYNLNLGVSKRFYFHN